MSHSAAVSEDKHPPGQADPSAPDSGADAGDAPRLRQRGSNQIGMRQFNDRVVLQALRVHGSMPKAELARLTGLTAQTIGLITARLANEAGRDVFAIPGSIHAEQSRGCHALIRDGARLVESAEEVLDELRQRRLPIPGAPEQTAASSSPDSDDADPLLDALGHDPVTLDSLQARTGWPTSDLLGRLLELELDGRVARLPGGLFQRRGLA